jgi:hypothetical protein
MTNRALRAFSSLPPGVRVLWLLAALLAVDVLARLAT